MTAHATPVALDLPPRLAAKIAKTPGGKKKLLALHGGGIRGALTLEVLHYTFEEDHLPLWQLVRASTAAPTYLPPARIRPGKREFLFADGGLTSYSNPAFMLFLMATAPGALMYAALTEQDVNCRVLGRRRAGHRTNSELGDLLHHSDAPGVLPKLFTCMRYDAVLTRDGLEELGIRDVEAERVRAMDTVTIVPDLQRIGRAVAERRAKAEHFQGLV
jgi:uncharacterized protein